MSSPGSCFRCSKAQAILSPNGLCEDCAATEATADPTPAEAPASELDPAGATVTDVPRVPPAEGPTATPPGSATGSAPADGFPVLPESPPGFELLRHLGGGGMGDVYLAREWPAGRDVALKFLKRPESPAASQRFVTELRVLAELDHPNIVGVLASDFQRATPYFTMARAAGGSLADALQAGLPAPDEAVRIIRVIAGAVAAAHAKGIIHRDLKPSNVLLFGAPGEWHQLKVADFGLAKRLGDEDGFTATEDMMGTPGYMPPEQVSRANGEDGKIDRRADVYGLGATLYHLLTGRAPFVGATKLGIVNQVLADAPERPRALRPEIPLALEAIALKCLAKDPVERYQSVAAFLGALDDYERLGRDPGATELTRRRRVRLWAARNRRGMGRVAAALAVVAGAFVVGRALGVERVVRTYLRPTPASAPQPPERLAAPAVVPLVPDLTQEDVVRALRRGERVELLNQKGPRVPVSWGLGPCEVIPPSREQPLALRSNGRSALHLLTDPGIDRYRLRVVLRQDLRTTVPGVRGSASAVGIAFGHRRVEAQNNQTVHALLAATFWEAPPDQPEPGAARFTDYGIVEFPLGTPSVSTHHVGHLPLVAAAPRSPRALELEVAPDGIVLRHDGRSLSWEPTALRRDWQELERALNANPRLAGPADIGTWSSRRPLGVWVQESWVTVLSFSIEPLH